MYLDGIQAKIPLTTIFTSICPSFATMTFLSKSGHVSPCRLDPIKPVCDNRFNVNCGRAFPTQGKAM